jgi:hypothetical protein
MAEVPRLDRAEPVVWRGLTAAYAPHGRPGPGQYGCESRWLSSQPRVQRTPLARLGDGPGWLGRA